MSEQETLGAGHRRQTLLQLLALLGSALGPSGGSPAWAAGEGPPGAGRSGPAKALAGVPTHALTHASASASSAGPAAPGSAAYRVRFLAFDFRNGGITAVYRAFAEACAALRWSLQVFNGEGSEALVRQQFAQALQDPSLAAVVLGGFDESLIQAQWRESQGVRPVLVGWHASSRPGPGAVLLTNVSSDPLQVAELAAQVVFDTAGPQVGVVLFNDSRFEIANAKTRRLTQVLQQHPRCQVLRTVDMPISEAHRRMPQAIVGLHETFGRQWTHLVAINDVYLDSMQFPLASVHRLDVVGIAAGDGSPSALSRIRGGRSAQYATIAEPLGPQGWQLANALWRHSRGLAAVDQQPVPVVVTTEYLQALARRPAGEVEAYKRQLRQAWGLGT